MQVARICDFGQVTFLSLIVSSSVKWEQYFLPYRVSVRDEWEKAHGSA